MLTWCETYAVTHCVDLERQPKEKQMGRPLNKRNFGTAAGAAAGIIVSAMKTDTARASTIVKQIGSKKFLVTNGTDGNFEATIDEGTSFTADTAGTVVIFGWVADTGATANESTSAGTQVAIKKITARRAIAFSGTKYKWTLQNDSAADYIELTAI